MQKLEKNALRNVTEVVRKDAEFIKKGIGKGLQWANKTFRMPKLTKSLDDFIWLRHVEEPGVSSEVSDAPSWPQPRYPELSGIDLFMADVEALETYLNYFYCISKRWTKPLPET